MVRLLLWTVGIVAVVLLVTYWWAGRNLQVLDAEARADAPGAFLEVSGGTLHYLVEGPEDGEIVVMVHGFSTPSFIFEQNAAALV
jgi:hypothetical protein